MSNMSKRNLIIAVIAGHVGVLLIAALIGGCAKTKKTKLATDALYEKMRAPEGKPESILEPKGMVEEMDLLVAREPESIPVRAEKPRKKMAAVARQPKKKVRPIIPELSPPQEAIDQPAVVKTHRVAPGESLWKISRLYNVTVAELAEANELDQNAILSVGKVLVIPPRGATSKVKKVEEKIKVAEPAPRPEEASPEMIGEIAAAETPPPAEEIVEVAAEPRKHVVQKGESLWSIAKNYGVPMEKLVEVNELEDPSKLKTGQVILIP